MLRSIKFRIYPNKSQENIILGTLNACRVVWNMYVGYNRDLYKETKEGEKPKFCSANEYCVKFTQIKKKDKYKWLNQYSAHALQHSIRDAYEAYQKFFKGIANRPRLKSKKRGDEVTSYFFQTNGGFYLYQNELSKRNKIYLPLLHEIRCPRKDQLPDQSLITGGRIIKEGDKYFALFHYQAKPDKDYESLSPGIGIDLGISNYATICDEYGIMHKSKDSFLDDDKYKEIEEEIHCLQRIRSNKIEINLQKLIKKYEEENGKEASQGVKDILRSKASYSQSIRKLNKRIARLIKKRTNYSENFICQFANELTKTKPAFITVERLDIIGMTDNEKETIVNGKHTLHDHIMKSKWYGFKMRLRAKCEERHIELREVNQYFTSSKYCSVCGERNPYLNLNDRTFFCLDPTCGNVMDRDENAARNLVKKRTYTVIAD